VIANRAFGLSRLLASLSKTGQAIEMVREAEEHVQALDSLSLLPDDRNFVKYWLLKVRNNLGWLLILDGRYAESLDVLEPIRILRESDRPLDAPCDSRKEKDVELATVYQNIADADLGLGLLQKAADAASFAEKCRTSKPRFRPNRKSVRALESGKTRGLALYYLGRKAEGLELLKKYVIGMSKELDDTILPASLMEGVVSGNRVSIRDLVNVDQINGNEERRGQETKK
jgi:hypothetical protein